MAEPKGRVDALLAAAQVLVPVLLALMMWVVNNISGRVDRALERIENDQERLTEHIITHPSYALRRDISLLERDVQEMERRVERHEVETH